MRVDVFNDTDWPGASGRGIWIHTTGRRWASFQLATRSGLHLAVGRYQISYYTPGVRPLFSVRECRHLGTGRLWTSKIGSLYIGWGKR